jgi:hypothetical protein
MEAKIVELHLRYHTRDEIKAVLSTNKTTVSRSMRQFHETSLIANALRIGRLSKRTRELAGLVDARMIQDPSLSGKSLGPSPEKAAGWSGERCHATVFHSHALSVQIIGSGDLHPAEVK